MANRCIMCGRIIEIEEVVPDPFADEDEAPKKPLLICLFCQAKLKHEADESQKAPKPM